MNVFMNYFRLFFVCFAFSLLAQEETSDGSMEPEEFTEDPVVLVDEASDSPRAKQFYIRHLEAKGIGFNKGYTTFGLFLSNPKPWWGHSIFFLDARAHVINNGKPAVNAGFGWRCLLGDCHAFGVNTYYDYRDSRKGYSQLGLGLEYFWQGYEIRSNGYFPIGSRVSSVYDLKFSHFFQNQLFISRKHEYSLTGADLEFGYRTRSWKQCGLFAGIGPYYYKGHYTQSAVGGKVRLEARFTPYLSLDFTESYDAVFRNRFQGQLTLSVPFGPRAKNTSSCCPDWNRLASSAWNLPCRNEMIVLDDKKKTSLGIDPVTGQPLFFVFVNNLSSSLGTFESPYSSLATAQNNSKTGDTIYVFTGDGTSTGMNAGITLQNQQRLLGSAVSHAFETTVGTVIIPNLTNQLPVITNVGAPVITLALDNEVSGFLITGGTSGIQGNWASVITNCTINRNELFLNGSFAIETNVSGSSIADLTIQNNLLSNPGDDHILINTTGAALARSDVSLNTFYQTANTPFLTGVHLLAVDDSIHASSIYENHFYGGDISAPVFNSIVMESAGSFASSMIQAEVLSNIIGGGSSGVIVAGMAGSAGSIQFRIEGNQFDTVNPASVIYNTLGAIGVNVEGSGLISGSIVNNLIDRSNYAGIYFNVPGGTCVCDILSNTILNTFYQSVFANSQGDLSLNLENNNIQHSDFSHIGGGEAVYLQITSGTFRIKMIQNLLDNNRSGDFLLNSNGGSSCVKLEDNNATGGFQLNSAGGSVQLEPYVGNQAGLFLSGPITFVPEGTCN